MIFLAELLAALLLVAQGRGVGFGEKPSNLGPEGKFVGREIEVHLRPLDCDSDT